MISITRTCSNSSIYIFDAIRLSKIAKYGPFISMFFLFLILFIAFSTRSVNKKIASFSFSLQFSVIPALLSVEFNSTTKQLNDKTINLMKTEFND